IWKTTFSFRVRWRWKAQLLPYRVLSNSNSLASLSFVCESMKTDATENLLEEDHRSIDDFVAQLCAALEAQDAEQSFALLDLVWARLAVHIRAEHLCLFPALLDAARQPSTSAEDVACLDDAQSIINRLGLDHDFFMVELARAVNKMREITSQDSDVVEERLRAVCQTITAVNARLKAH